MKAVEVLAGHLKPVEIAEVLSLPKRTVYDLIKRAREKAAREEAERRKREETQGSLQPEWTEVKRKEPQESVLIVPGIRRYRS